MAKTGTRPWDAAEHLETEEDVAAYLEAALEEGDPALVAAALGDIARAEGMAQIPHAKTVSAGKAFTKRSRLKAIRSSRRCSRCYERLVCGCTRAL
jgi:probable addiction module antidote protein